MYDKHNADIIIWKGWITIRMIVSDFGPFARTCPSPFPTVNVNNVIVGSYIARYHEIKIRFSSSFRIKTSSFINILIRVFIIRRWKEYVVAFFFILFLIPGVRRYRASRLTRSHLSRLSKSPFKRDDIESISYKTGSCKFRNTLSISRMTVPLISYVPIHYIYVKLISRIFAISFYSIILHKHFWNGY